MRMTFHLASACAVGIGFAAALPPPPAAAQQQVQVGEQSLTITTIPAVATDYRFRGISQTRRDPAVQVTLDIEHESGIYIGAFASNVDFAGLDARLEIDLLAGYRFEALGFKWDLGVVYYAYPGYTKPPGGFQLDWLEIAGRVTREFGPVTALASVYFAPDFQLESGNAVYVEGGADVKLPFDLTLSGRIGYQAIDRNPRFGTPDYWNWSVAVSRDVLGFTLSVGYYDTNISRRDCSGGLDICRATALASISRKF